ncbi:MAG: branched-chain amino acid ABC transporter permease [Acidimicrobiia bacterium]|nr:branched-chain amino acid ABC transporter permease [Acidimicrobiia bacterium]MYC57594.1 branched-chain amino acid ABC transporter permease [Acidimicrobiia bacterium]MYG94884.1 branched-chain amino acid ABC transporter permease [Acidimicrobiia bacterium]MYI31275.1 branched-chain amino acid ABC transporter permease [Acidimicrobiia bacterium]
MLFCRLATTLGTFDISLDKLSDGELWLAQFFRGLSDGATYASLALALVMIYKSTGFINFAQGSLALLGVYLVYVFSVEQGLPIAVAVVCAMVASALVAMFIERTFIRPFPPNNVLPLVIVTLGLLLIIDSAVGIVWQFRTRSLPSMFSDSAPIQWGIARLTWRTIGNLGAVFVVVGLLYVLMARTKIGLAFRAVSSNLESAQLMGIRVGSTLGFGWALAAAIGTLSGALVVPDLLLEPSVMLRVLIFSLAAAALGGLDSMVGAVLGGLVVGLTRNLLVTFLDLSELALATAVAVILVVLLARPTGFLGTVRRERV